MCAVCKFTFVLHWLVFLTQFEHCAPSFVVSVSIWLLKRVNSEFTHLFTWTTIFLRPFKTNKASGESITGSSSRAGSNSCSTLKYIFFLPGFHLQDLTLPCLIQNTSIAIYSTNTIHVIIILHLDKFPFGVLLGI